LNVDFKDIDELNIISKESKLVKKWARNYDVLLVSDSLKLKFIKMVGKQVNSVGQQPSFILENENVEAKV
jgi:hypothetical protein